MAPSDDLSQISCNSLLKIQLTGKSKIVEKKKQKHYKLNLCFQVMP